MADVHIIIIISQSGNRKIYCHICIKLLSEISANFCNVTTLNKQSLQLVVVVVHECLVPT